MARTIATVTGIALAPGVSRNGRLYTREAISKAVRRAQARIAEGKRPIAMYTDHDTRKVTDIAGGLTSVWQDEDGVARYKAAITDTRAGRDIIALADPGPDGKQAILRGLSIKGDWIGRQRQVRAGDGRLVMTADDLEIARLDWTTEPGVDDAGVERFELAPAGSREDAGQFGISEAAPDAELTIAEDAGEAQVTVISEETGAPDAGIREVLGEFLRGQPHVFSDGLCVTCPAVAEAKDPKKPYGDVQYADPGYLDADGKQASKSGKPGVARYPLDAKHVRAAWSYINQAKNAAQYTAAQLKRVKGRIKAAMGRIGAKVAAEGWVINPATEVTEAVAEYMGDPSSCGSYSISATNGPTNICVSGYGLDPADLEEILRAACDGACKALASLDPDMDGDIDVPGADSEDTDDDADDQADDQADDLAARLAAAIRGESAENLDDLITEARNQHQPVTETASETTAPDEAAAAPTSEEGSAVSETTVTEAATAPAVLTQADVAAAVAKALADDKAARKARKAARVTQAAESATVTAGVQETGAVTGSEEDRISAIVEAKLAEAGLAPVTETDEQRISRIAEERVTQRIQELAAAGHGPARKGLVTEHSAARAAAEIPANLPFDGDGKVRPRESWTEDETRAVGEQLEAWVLAPRAAHAAG